MANRTTWLCPFKYHTHISPLIFLETLTCPYYACFRAEPVTDSSVTTPTPWRAARCDPPPLRSLSSRERTLAAASGRDELLYLTGTAYFQDLEREGRKVVDCVWIVWLHASLIFMDAMMNPLHKFKTRQWLWGEWGRLEKYSVQTLDTATLSSFKAKLKTFLFSQYFHPT